MRVSNSVLGTVKPDGPGFWFTSKPEKFKAFRGPLAVAAFETESLAPAILAGEPNVR